MSAVRIVMVLWGIMYLALGPLRSPGDGDLYWQRWLGDLVLQTRHLPLALGNETFTSAGAAWVPQEWFFSILVAIAMNHDALVIFAAIVSSVPVAILASVYLRSREASTPEAIAIALLLCGAALLESFGVRAQGLGWGCLAAFICALERRDRWCYAAFPIAVIWANLHASVMIAPAIVAARIVASLADGGIRALRANRDVYLLIPILLATFCTPLGAWLPLYALTLIGSPIRRFIVEWQPSGLHDGSFIIGALPLAALILAGGLANLRQNKLQAFPAALLFVAMLFASRNIPLFAIVAAPLAAKGLDIRFPRMSAVAARIRALEPAAIASIGAAVTLSALLLAWEQRHEPPRLPTAAMASLAADRANRRVFCENFTWCSLALQYRNLRVFMDGRCDPYPLHIWKSYISAITLRKPWTWQLRRYRVDAVLAQRGSPFARAMAKDRSWRTSFKDPGYVVFRRD
ncbi:MAG: hypothetical protein ABI231_00405 [Candidatus Tumulicola sp.]